MSNVTSYVGHVGKSTGASPNYVAYQFVSEGAQVSHDISRDSAVLDITTAQHHRLGGGQGAASNTAPTSSASSTVPAWQTPSSSPIPSGSPPSGTDHHESSYHHDTLMADATFHKGSQEAVCRQMAGSADAVADVDGAVRQLRQQQGDIQTRLDALSISRRDFDTSEELRMLIHKYLILQNIVHQNGLDSRIPVLSEAEEARSLQFQCERLEASCIQYGSIDPAEALKQSSCNGPEGFADWLEKHIERSDPVMGNAGSNYPAVVSEASAVESQTPHRHVSLRSYRCSDETCAHYIYGFPTEDGRHIHAHAHSRQSSDRYSDASPAKPSPCPLQLNHATDLRTMPDCSYQVPPTCQARSTSSNSPPPLGLQIQIKDTLESGGLNFSSDLPDTRKVPYKADSDSMLPPLDGNLRAGRSRLQSIGELQLVRKTSACLYCRVFGLSLCNEGSGVNMMVFRQDMSATGQTTSPAPSPVVQVRGDGPTQMHSFISSMSGYVREMIDFPDAFWSSCRTEQKRWPRTAAHGEGQGRKQPAHDLLVAFATSHNYRGTAYDIFQLLKVTGKLSRTREMEEAEYPVLFHAKFLLREMLLYSDAQSESAVYANSSAAGRPPLDGADARRQMESIYEQLERYLQVFEETTLQHREVHGRDGRPGVRQWLGTFFSLCLFSVVRELLIDMELLQWPQTLKSSAPPPGSSTGSEMIPTRTCIMHGAYRAMVDTFGSVGPSPMDSLAGALLPEELSIIEVSSQIVRRETWAARSLKSSYHFLELLGFGPPEDPVVHGFVRQLQSSGNSHAALQLAARTAGQGSESPAAGIGPEEAPRTYRSTRDHCSYGRHSGSPDDEVGGQVSPWCTPRHARRHNVETIPASPRSLKRRRTRAADSETPGGVPRARLPRVFCTKCTEHPEGFRGDHELRRHTEAKHAALVRQWVCKEPGGQVPAGGIEPTVPLARCKACRSGKSYGAYYNAAAHLRRAHFHPHRGSEAKASSDWPAMNILKDWMQEVFRVSGWAAEDDGSMGDVDGHEGRRGRHQGVRAIHGTATSSRHQHISVTDGNVHSPGSRGGQLASPGWVREDTGGGRCPHPDCGRVFKDLASHMVTHQEERPEKCPIVTCEYHGKGFARRYDRNRHALAHYRKTMPCPFCPRDGAGYGTSFNRTDAFKRHLTQVHHAEQTPPNSLKLSAGGAGSTYSHHDGGGGDGTDGNDGGGGGGDAGCTICWRRFGTAQDFYEHLDDCVLGVLGKSVS
ncbi:ZnF C2H2 [Geosmithia morbida]|uniref:ZnF C2H2 n=1 Tax=Geosmithia morbida TaxID=1094350 RepID=A0A9P5D3K5_9HYPO|nr:ZnF C2H2 [Geosmithia morbida]KAF4122626.1 ZnF C2H2 [Geosmithia morbida]